MFKKLWKLWFQFPHKQMCRERLPRKVIKLLPPNDDPRWLQQSDDIRFQNAAEEDAYYQWLWNEHGGCQIV